MEQGPLFTRRTFGEAMDRAFANAPPIRPRALIVSLGDVSSFERAMEMDLLEQMSNPVEEGTEG